MSMPYNRSGRQEIDNALNKKMCTRSTRVGMMPMAMDVPLWGLERNHIDVAMQMVRGAYAPEAMAALRNEAS